MELQDYWRAVRNHWIGVLLLIVGTCAAGALFTALQTPVYAANAAGFVGTGSSDNAALGSVTDQLAKSRATSYIAVAKSRATAQTVIDELGLHTTPSALVSHITVSQPVDTVYLNIVAESASPKEAQQLADAWVAALAVQVQAIESPAGPPSDGTPRIVPQESAALPGSPASPRPERNLAIAFVLGCLLALGYAVLRSTLDRRLRSADDVESHFGIPVVASIPTAPTLRHEPGAAATLALHDTDEAGSAAAEAFRKLRTNLMFMDVDNPPRSLVITSPRPGDGKSTVAANIAAALESTGQPVILIDADLRRPTVAASFAVDGAVGLTNVLTGQVSVEDALQTPAGFTSLRVLAAGAIPPNPSELLGSRAMRTLVEKLAQDHIVVLDAPPLLPVTDAALLSTATDGVMLVISSGATVDAELETCLGSITTVNGRVLGVVLNRVSARHDRAGSYAYYGYRRDRTPQSAEPVAEPGA
ncbi:capsular exopolysaccharide family [Nocardioides terrae]|uniref:non-specific protein-tyrosine kinase n=1 Tax=Nocardioides terrae TaxID=574651 RepID=A0A1I1EJA4_9ACTN|nr:polysaccharide biosynthesis tyrosine autokinase [Nocardioides terrae]SFB87131.1 capsular exopolysaccharide family [Nocardioides terrae]